MSASASIATVSVRHEAIIEYLVLNPTQRKSEVAAHFKVSPSWLSTIIHSDAFQDQLKKRQDQFFSAATASVAEKLTTLAHLAVDRLIDKIQVETDHAEIRETAETALDRIGYLPLRGASSGTGSSIGVQQNNYYAAPVSAELLAASRQRILQRQGITIDALPAPAASALPAGGDSDLGGHLADAAAVLEAESVPGQAG